MSDDDERRRGPQPPHERAWRHPAELGEWTRARDAVAAAPPPLSRRMTAVIAATSLAVSVAIAVIAVPRSGRDDASDSGLGPSMSLRASVTTTVTASGVDPAEEPAPASVPAVRVGDYFVAMLEQVEAASGPYGVVLVTPDARPAGVIARDESIGIVVLVELPDDNSPDGIPPNGSAAVGPDVAPFDDTPHSIAPGASESLEQGSKVVLVASDGSTTDAVVGLSVGKRPGLHPLEMNGRPVGACLVRGVDGAEIGVAVHHRHSTWLVTRERVAAVIDAARASTN